MVQTKGRQRIDRPETCVVSADQTERGISQTKLAALLALLDETQPRLWIYVGASMRDNDLLRTFQDTDFARGTDGALGAPFVVSTVDEYGANREPFWRERRLRTMKAELVGSVRRTAAPTAADAFFAEFRSAWPGSP